VTLVLLLVAVMVMAVPSAAVADDAPLKIVAFGDSLTSGHRLPSRQAYPAVLEEQLKAAGVPAKVENHGVDSETSAGGLRRLDDLLEEKPDILIVAFGANDGLRGVPVAQMRANLSRMIEAAQTRGIAVLLVGMEALPLHGWQYTIDFHHVFPELAAKYKVPFVPFMLNGVFGNPDLIAPDGVHPNAAGAKVIAANIFPEVRALAQKIGARR
jgi:acyl-CoA thioesterase-1